jgi:hypothetical protein
VPVGTWIRLGIAASLIWVMGSAYGASARIQPVDL